MKKMVCLLSFVFLIFPLTSIQFDDANSQELEKSLDARSTFVNINLSDYSSVYEGCIIKCSIKGTPERIFWTINNQSEHETFYGNNPVLFDPEPTPADKQYCTLRVHAIYNDTSVSDAVIVKLHRLFFGDIHFHSIFSDGYNSVDALYENAITDNYVDFACLTDHAEIVNELDFTPPQPVWMFTRSLLQYLRYKSTNYDEWKSIKEKANEYYQPGSFTTFLGYEYSPGPWYKGGFPWSSHGHEDISHVNFYYKDVYPDAPEFSARDCLTWHEILDKMNEEHNNGHLNIAFPHHPLSTFGFWGEYTVNWTYLAQNVIAQTHSNVLMGAEVYSKWGQSIGKYSDIPITWSYGKSTMSDKPVYWVETALWEWSKLDNKHPFLMIASSDNHATNRPASASLNSRISKGHPNPAGLIATYAVHNTRAELWESIANGYAYGLQLLKIRAHASFDGQNRLGQWITCSSPLNITISAMSTFNGTDSSGKSMRPHAYSADELAYPIEDIWIVKKDTSKGQPWCKVIAHKKPQSHVAVMTYQDNSVKPDDFYYVVIRQKGDYLKDNADSYGKTDEYLAFLGPIFIREVT